jgi:hypothetical protein
MEGSFSGEINDVMEWLDGSSSGAGLALTAAEVPVILKIEKPVAGAVCRICSLEPAAEFCRSCTVKVLCQQCSSFIHSKQSHHVVVPWHRKYDIPLCSRHNENCDLYCINDHTCICHLCSLDEHKGHDIEPVSRRAELSKDKVRGVISRVQHITESLRFHRIADQTTDNLGGKRKHEAISDAISEEVIKNISDSFQLIRDELNRREQTLIYRARQLQALKDEKDGRLESQKEMYISLANGVLTQTLAFLDNESNKTILELERNVLQEVQDVLRQGESAQAECALSSVDDISFQFNPTEVINAISKIGHVTSSGACGITSRFSVYPDGSLTIVACDSTGARLHRGGESMLFSVQMKHGDDWVDVGRPLVDLGDGSYKMRLAESSDLTIEYRAKYLDDIIGTVVPATSNKPRSAVSGAQGAFVGLKSACLIKGELLLLIDAEMRFKCFTLTGTLIFTQKLAFDRETSICHIASSMSGSVLLQQDSICVLCLLPSNINQGSTISFNFDDAYDLKSNRIERICCNDLRVYMLTHRAIFAAGQTSSSRLKHFHNFTKSFTRYTGPKHMCCSNDRVFFYGTGAGILALTADEGRSLWKQTVVDVVGVCADNSGQLFVCFSNDRIEVWDQTNNGGKLLELVPPRLNHFDFLSLCCVCVGPEGQLCVYNSVTNSFEVLIFLKI